MKQLGPLLLHLSEGTTTLAWCWRITRADGEVLGFTDHDRALSFDGTTFEPESGLIASEIRASSDLAADAQEAEGVLSSSRITETDILDGRWDTLAVSLGGFCGLFLWRRDGVKLAMALGLGAAVLWSGVRART